MFVFGCERAIACEAKAWYFAVEQLAASSPLLTAICLNFFPGRSDTDATDKFGLVLLGGRISPRKQVPYSHNFPGRIFVARFDSNQITVLLEHLKAGDALPEEIYAAAYNELRAMAGNELRKRGPSVTLQPTALVNDVFLRLFGDGEKELVWQNRSHFFSFIGTVMRRALVDYYRHKSAAVRGGEHQLVLLEDDQVGFAEPAIELQRLDEALVKLGHVRPDLERVVVLRYFAGLTIKETAEVLGVADKTVKRYWATAKAWLLEELSDE